VRIKNGNESEVCSKWYMEKYFSNEELRVLVDGLVFSKLITAKQAKELIKKVETLGDSNFSSKIDYVQILTDKKIGNEELFQNISKIDEAIKDKKKIRFIYNSYDIDKKLHPRKNSKGEMKEYLVNPYQIIAEAGRYYLLCNYDKYDNLSHYKLDLITNIQTTDKTVKKRERVKGFGQEFNLPEHLAEQIYMLEGTNVWVEFTVKKDVLDSVIDWFGDNIEFRKYKSDDEVLARVNVNMKAMRFWALQYGNYVKVLNPPELVSEIKEDIRNIAEKYKN
jgi:predicted DNA-binding transcriptional regulator YafY